MKHQSVGVSARSVEGVMVGTWPASAGCAANHKWHPADKPATLMLARVGAEAEAEVEAEAEAEAEGRRASTLLTALRVKMRTPVIWASSLALLTSLAKIV